MLMQDYDNKTNSEFIVNNNINSETDISIPQK